MGGVVVLTGTARRNRCPLPVETYWAVISKGDWSGVWKSSRGGPKSVAGPGVTATDITLPSLDI